MSDYYILEGKKAVPCGPTTWAVWFEKRDNRRVDTTEKDGVRVSTVFLGLDHGYGEGPPLIFETMIFGGEHDQYQERCSTWDEAEAMHKTACTLAFGTTI